MNRDSLHDEDEAFEQVDGPQPTNGDRMSEMKAFQTKDIRDPITDSLPPLPILPPIAGNTGPVNPSPTVDPPRNPAASSQLNETRLVAGLIKREMELANLNGQNLPVVPSQPDSNMPAPPVMQGRDARANFGTIEGQMKKDMPQEVVTRLNTILILCYINVLFLLIYFPITIALRFINEPNSSLSSRAAFIIYIALELLNLLMTVLTFKIAEGLTRPILKCWVWFMLINAILNLVLGIVVFSYATEDKSTTWNTLNLVTKRYFNNDSDSYKSFYRINMTLIGIFLIVELIVFLILSFVVYLLFSVLLENGNYKPTIGKKPFTEMPFLKKADIDVQTYTILDFLGLQAAEEDN